jgi:DNA-binding NtrC family response regulator
MTAPRPQLQSASQPAVPSLPTLDLGELERIAITQALEATNGNRVHAARLLHIHVRTLHRKMRGQRETRLALV